jgi:hypothetical protein
MEELTADDKRLLGEIGQYHEDALNSDATFSHRVLDFIEDSHRRASELLGGSSEDDEDGVRGETNNISM